MNKLTPEQIEHAYTEAESTHYKWVHLTYPSDVKEVLIAASRHLQYAPEASTPAEQPAHDDAGLTKEMGRAWYAEGGGMQSVLAVVRAHDAD